MKLSIIKWRHWVTGATGSGQPIKTEIAQLYVDQLNRKHKDIQHWLVAAN